MSSIATTLAYTHHRFSEVNQRILIVYLSSKSCICFTQLSIASNTQDSALHNVPSQMYFPSASDIQCQYYWACIRRPFQFVIRHNAVVSIFALERAKNNFLLSAHSLHYKCANWRVLCRCQSSNYFWINIMWTKIALHLACSRFVWTMYVFFWSALWIGPRSWVLSL